MPGLGLGIPGEDPWDEVSGPPLLPPPHRSHQVWVWEASYQGEDEAFQVWVWEPYQDEDPWDEVPSVP